MLMVAGLLGQTEHVVGGKSVTGPVDNEHLQDHLLLDFATRWTTLRCRLAFADKAKIKARAHELFEQLRLARWAYPRLSGGMRQQVSLVHAGARPSLIPDGRAGWRPRH
jgi:ABC-type nitrate/sulfonate/bicarbonate transport system ATPase subunit